MSIGANDIWVLDARRPVDPEHRVGKSKPPEYHPSDVNADLAALPEQYAMLGQAIKGLDPGKVLITGYPDLTRNSRGKISPIVFLGFDIISAIDAKFAANNIIAPLDHAVETAAQANGWTYVNYDTSRRSPPLDRPVVSCLPGLKDRAVSLRNEVGTRPLHPGQQARDTKQ